MRQTVLDTGLQRTRNDRAIFRSCVNPTGDDEKPFVNHTFEITPQLISTPQEGDVARVLRIGQPDDSIDTHRGTKPAGHIKLVNA